MVRAASAFVLVLALSACEVEAQVPLAPVRYELDLTVDFEEAQLKASARLTVQNASPAAVGEVSLLLYRLLRVEAVTDEHGAVLSFEQRVVAFEDFGQLQVNQIVVALPRRLEPGDAMAITVRYAGFLLGYVETGMLYVQDRIDPAFTILRDDAWAFPRPGYPSWAANRAAPEARFTYAARVTVPASYTVANGGRLDGVDRSNGTVTYRYSSLQPAWRLDFAIAAYGEKTVGPIHVFHLPEDAQGAERIARAADEVLRLYTRWFGPPGEATRLTLIEIPDGWGSQADGATILQSAAAFRDPERHREVYHEVSHLWNPPATDRPSPRWNEGLASFLEYLATQELAGEEVVDARADQLVAWLVHSLPTHPEWREVPLVDYGRARMTDLSYSVGALYFDLLYRLCGRDSFNRIVSQFATRFGSAGGSTLELIEVARESCSKDLSALHDDWILTTRWTQRVDAANGIRALEAVYRGKVDATR